jgi:7-cyano-7-deazaguanine reductase
MHNLSLGQPTEYPQHYDASLLQPVPRALNREPIGIEATALPFYGFDEWTGYELSWLNAKGKPQVAIARCSVPATTPSLVESKSFKLYLNSFNQTHVADWSKLQTMLVNDLSACAGGPVSVKLFTLADFAQAPISMLPGASLDDQDIEIDEYDYDPALLACDGKVVAETLHSDLLKSNCLITNQPDWGSVVIDYQGPAIDKAALLRYLISFRNHNEFHEQCVERIFQDLMHHCHCQQLTVSARYTRRGGLDINPVRSTNEHLPQFDRTVRQ